MRKYYLDNIRWITVILVLFYHVLYMYNAEGILGGVGNITGLKHQYYDVYFYAVYPWFMFLLFLVSGISARYYLEGHSHKEFIRTRTRKLLVPSTIGLFVFQFIQGYISMALGGAFDTMQDVPGLVKYFIMVLSGTGVLWYIQLLWVLSLILVLVRKLERDRLWEKAGKTNVLILILLVLLVWGGAQILNTPVVVVYRFGYYGVAFFLGYFVFSHDEVIEVLKKYSLLFLVIAAAIGTIFCIVYFGQNYAERPVNRSILFTFFGWFMSLAIIGNMAKYADFENGFTRWMNARSFGLYVFHYLGISAVALYLAGTGITAALIYLLSTVAGFASGYLLYAVISRVPFFRWAVLGIKKPKEKNISQEKKNV